MSALAEHAERYLAVRKSLGYRLRDDVGMVKALAAYAGSLGGGVLSTEVALGWASAARADSTHQRRLSVARGFAAYLRAFEPASEVPPRGLGPLVDRRRRRPHIYTGEEVAALMAAAGEGEAPLTGSSASALIGLAAACGLRPAELYRLRCADIDLQAGQVAVMESKRARSRLLPLHPSTAPSTRTFLRISVHWSMSVCTFRSARPLRSKASERDRNRSGDSQVLPFSIMFSTAQVLPFWTVIHRWRVCQRRHRRACSPTR